MQAAFLAYLGADGMQQIQETQVDGMDFTGAVIPQNRVDRSNGIPVVATVLVIVDLYLFAGMGVEKLEGAHATVLRSGDCIKCLGKCQSGRQEGSYLEKASAGKMRIVCQAFMRRLHSRRFSHASHPIAWSLEVNGRLPSAF